MNLKVMTWNVENLFRPKTEFGPTTEDAYEAKLKILADGITALNPDVVALQEVGSEQAFDDLKKRLGGSYAHGSLSTNPDQRGIRVGFLSKLPLKSPREITKVAPNSLVTIKETGGDAFDRMRRGALWVQVEVDGVIVNIITAHLKSKLLQYPKAGGTGSSFEPKDENQRAQVASQALAIRAAEAHTLRTVANSIIAANQERALIILGDLNDVADAATTQLLYGPEGSQPEAQGGVRSFDRPDKGDDARLFNVGNLIPLERRYSRITNGVRELIDHILASAELVTDPKSGKRVKPIVDSHPHLQGTIESVGNNPSERKNKPGSDHAPVTALFKF